MSDRLNGWWQKWGPWVGPTALLALLTVASRMEACVNAKAGEAAYAEANRAAIKALEKRQDSTDRWIEEHKQVASSRIAQLDSIDKMVALLKAQSERTDADVREMKADIREIRNVLRYRTGRP